MGIWDMANWRKRAVLSGHTGRVEAMAVAPDGSWLATVDNERTVRIWDMTTLGGQAMMRVDNDITTCAWLRPDALVLGGPGGLYLFGIGGLQDMVNARQGDRTSVR